MRYTDGYGMDETDGPMDVITDLTELPWLMAVLSELPGE
jgi:hypothetical protein